MADRRFLFVCQATVSSASVSPVNPVRLAELNHQRALVREQLAWLEREIARETIGEGLSTFVPPPPVPQSVVQVRTEQLTASPQIQKEIEAYQPDPISAVRDTRRGCFIALAISALVLIGVFTAIYLLHYRDRPLLFVSGDPNVRKGASPVSPEQPSKK